ncbi:hypothetical protein WAE61_02040 [Comamonadaceae bacterium PP-2]
MAKPRVKNNLPAFVTKVQEKGVKGMTQALILGASEAVMFTPRDTSVLINSQYRHVEVDGTKVVGRVGYTAEYALAVHEAEGKTVGKSVARPLRNGKAHGNFWDPSGEPEFLAKGFEQAEPNIRNVIAGSIKT